MKIKLFYSPRLYKPDLFGYQSQPPFIPPMGMSMLTSFLKKKNFDVKQDDLDIKVFSDNKYSKNERKKVDMSLFDDRERIANFIKTGEDEQLEEYARRILKKTEYKTFDMIGFSICDDHNFSAIGSTIVLSKIIKEETGATIIIGGLRHQRKIFEEKLTELSYIDFIVLHNHIKMLELLEKFETGRVKGQKIENVSYNQKYWKDYLKFKKNNKPPKRSFEFKKADDIIPPPNFEGLPLDLYTPQFDDKYNLKIKRLLLLPFSFVTGCLEGCVFCPNSDNSSINLRNPEKVANELKDLSKKYKTRHFLFLNTNVNPTYEYANRLVNELINIDANIIWSDCANLKHLDKKLLIKLRKSGAVRLVYGLESASPKMLKFIEKGISQRRAKKMLKISHKVGIWNELELIAGIPHETEKDVKETASFVIKNKQYINYFYLAKYMLMNSKISRFPGRYKIKNIQDNIKTLEKIQPFNRRFDEIGGLKWDDKVNQIEHSFNKLCCAISDTSDPVQWTNQRGYNSQGEMLHLLLYLYTKLDKKQDIVDYFKNI